MIKCEVCQREFKTKQGLTGHMRFVHGMNPARQVPLFPPKRFVTDEQLVEALGNHVEALTKHGKVLTEHANRVAELERLVVALLTVHFLPNSKISLDSMPAHIQSTINSALATK